jgi:hypothetical protein
MYVSVWPLALAFAIILLPSLFAMLSAWRAYEHARIARADAARAEAVATAALAAVDELKSTGVVPFDIPKKDA